jgi:hypothetical protein
VSVDRRSITPRAAIQRFASANRSAILGAAAFSAVAVRLAWLSDDGAITARVIANTLTGYGPNSTSPSAHRRSPIHCGSC